VIKLGASPKVGSRSFIPEDDPVILDLVKSGKRGTEPVIPKDDDENVRWGFASSSSLSKLSAVSRMMAIQMWPLLEVQAYSERDVLLIILFNWSRHLCDCQ